MSDRAGFMSAILADPNDDTHRLVFADWLDENREPQRAEFIRAQIAASHGTALDTMQVWGLLHHSEQWFPDVCEAMRVGWNHWGVMHDGTVHYEHKLSPSGFFVRRGFVEDVGCPVADYMAHAAALFRAHPITGVWLMGKEPGTTRAAPATGRGFWWEPGLRFDGRRQIPFDIGEAGVSAGVWRVGFHGGLMVYVPTDSKPRDRGFATPELARAALSAACVAYGRQVARDPAPADADDGCAR